MRLRDEIRRIDAANENVETRYRTREIGIEYIDNVGPRPKKRGLFGVYPGDAHVAFGVDNWERLHVSTKTVRAMEKLSRRVKGEEDAERIIRREESVLEPDALGSNVRDNTQSHFLEIFEWRSDV